MLKGTASALRAETKNKRELIGYRIERLGEDIKDVTYHDLDIHQRKDKI